MDVPISDRKIQNTDSHPENSKPPGRRASSVVVGIVAVAVVALSCFFGVCAFRRRRRSCQALCTLAGFHWNAGWGDDRACQSAKVALKDTQGRAGKE
jgi:hypothetical protein